MTVEEARSVAERYGAIYMETSALTGEGVSEVFEHFVRYGKQGAACGMGGLGGCGWWV